MSQSTVLVPASGNNLPSSADFAQAEQALVTLREQGDVDTLEEARRQAEAARLYYARSEHKDAADGFARLKVLAEAAIGRIDLDQCPDGGGRPGTGAAGNVPLVIAGQEISTPTRRNWRLAGIGQVRGLLEKALEDLTATDEGIGTGAVRDKLIALGTLWVDPTSLVAAFEESGLTASEVARRAGMLRHSSAVHNALGPSKITKRNALKYTTAVLIAQALGVDPATLPPVHHVEAEAHTRARLRAVKARRALREQEREQEIKHAVRKAGAAISELYAMAERMQDVIGQAQREAIDPEAKTALSLVGEHHRRMRDQVVRALGVSG